MKGPHPERLELWHSGVTFLPFLWPQAQVTCSCLIWGSPLYQHRKNKVVVATITQFSQGIIFKLLLIWSGFGILSFFFPAILVACYDYQYCLGHPFDVGVNFLSFTAWPFAGILNTRQSIEIKEDIRDKTAGWLMMRNYSLTHPTFKGLHRPKTVLNSQPEYQGAVPFHFLSESSNGLLPLFL